MAEQAVSNNARDGAVAPAPEGVPSPPEPEAPSRSAAPSGSGFVGRRRELAALRADIHHPGLDTLAGRRARRSRVLLIVGRPGSGRTALAGELARQVAADYPDGTLRARLSTSDGTPVPTERVARDLLGALAVPVPPGASVADLTATVRTELAARRILLLLDDAASAEQVAPLLPDAAGTLVVVVGRGPLTGVPDVRPCTVGALGTPPALEILIQRAGPTRITCDPVAAESVVIECAAQPAALVLAGGWLAARPTASVADLLRRLREQPAVDSSGPAGQPLARVFRLVYASLPPSVARMLRLVSLTPDGLVDAHSLSALAGCAFSVARGTLADFAAHGLLRAVRPGEAEASALVPRASSPAVKSAGEWLPPQYHLPGSLAALLREALTEEERGTERELARARMLERMVRQLVSCRLATEPPGSARRQRLGELPRPLRFPSPEAAAQWLAARFGSLLAAVRMAVRDGDVDTLARRLATALTQAISAHRSSYRAADELYGLHSLVLEVAERQRMPRESATALLHLGDLDALADRPRQAVSRYRAALDHARTAADPRAIGRALESLGSGYQELGDWYRAADWYGRALELRLSRHEMADGARLYGRLGAVWSYAARWEEALRNWRAAAGGYRRAGDPARHARALGETARVLEYAGRPEEARRACVEALARAEEAGEIRLQAALRLRLSAALNRLGERTAAIRQQRAAERLLEHAPAGENPGFSCEISGAASKD